MSVIGIVSCNMSWYRKFISVEGGITVFGDLDLVVSVFSSVLYSSDLKELYDTRSFFLSAVEWSTD